MQRYEEFTDVINIAGGSRRYGTLYYSNIDYHSTDIYIITKKSDRLDLLANKYYGDVRKWIFIAKANNIFSPTLRIEPGIKLRIPSPENTIQLNNFFQI